MGDALADKFGLTWRESEVLALIAEGLTNPQIADTLGISVRTVVHRTTGIYMKLNVNTRLEAAYIAWDLGVGS